MNINDIDYLNKVFDFTFLGISFKDPLFFITKIIVIYAFIRIITFLVKRFFRRVAENKTKIVLDETNANFFRRIVVTAVYIIGISSMLALIPGMEKISSSILASAGIIAMAVGLASQEALSNIVGGLFIIFARPFRKGDFIEVDGGYSGTVDEITLRHTIIKSLANKLIIIPNSKINSATVTNATIGDPYTCSFIEIGVAYNSDLNKVIETMRDEIMQHPLLIDHRSEEDKRNGTPKVIIRVVELGDFAISLRAWAWASSNANAFTMKCDLLKSIKERFDKEGIEIPFPSYNQFIHK